MPFSYFAGPGPCVHARLASAGPSRPRGASWPRRPRTGRVRSLGKGTRAPGRGGLAGLGIGTCGLCGLRISDERSPRAN
jgi:hypothetical protein